MVQGGLIVGHAAPGSVIFLDGLEVRVDEEGRFVFGLDRDQPEDFRLWVIAPSGDEETYIFQAEQRDYDTQRIDGLAPRYVSPPEEVLERIAREREMIAKVRAVDRVSVDYQSGWEWPVIGPITGVFGSQRILNGEPRQPHYGIDIAAPAGARVRAPADGLVVLAEPDLYYTGVTVIIDHGAGVTSAFLHLESMSVELGEEVERGDTIGRVGSTGRSTGAHLDWRVNWFDRRIDPMMLAGPMPEQTN